MNKVLSLCVILIPILAQHSFSRPLSGSVTAFDGTPISTARLWLLNHTGSSISNNEGTFEIASITAYRLQQQKSTRTEPFFTSNRIHFTVTNPTSQVTILLHNLSGQCVKTLTDASLSRGDHIVPIKPELIAAGVYILTLRIGLRSSHFRINNDILLQKLQTASTPRFSSASATITSAIIDTLVCDAAGYYPQIAPIMSYDTSVVFTLEGNAPSAPVISFTNSPVYTLSSGTSYDQIKTITASVTTASPLDRPVTLLEPRHQIDCQVPHNFYPVTYIATDDFGERTVAVRYVTIIQQKATILPNTTDRVPPLISLSDTIITLSRGSAFKSPEVTIYDNREGFIDQFVTTGIVNSTQPGNYTVSYYCCNRSGSTGRCNCHVIVQ